jgi:hypothetical protein
MMHDERELSISGNTTRSCASCSYFRTTQAAHPNDDGECFIFNDSVRGDFVCNSFLSVHEFDKAARDPIYNGR